ncbi:MAG: hypothetical protein U0821_14885 [Chloroflexota bacterium]
MTSRDVRSLTAFGLLLSDLGRFSAFSAPVALHDYQLEIGRAILDSVLDDRGLSFTVLMPRQAGKNELSAQLEAFVMVRFMRRGGNLVKCAPTLSPQLLNSRARLERVLAGPLTRSLWRRRSVREVSLGRASLTLLSAEPRSNVVGATASRLLECDEAQDVDPDKWERDFRPMGATTNVTAVLYGTPWTDDTLLSRQIQEGLDLEARDGVRRHFEVDWTRVADRNPAYGRHVQKQIERLGVHHPIIRTQYLLKTVSGTGRFLDSRQVALMLGDHPPEAAPSRDLTRRGCYVAGIDVAGEDEEDPNTGLRDVRSGRDSTVLTVAFAEEARCEGGVVEPRFRVVRQYLWRGTPHREVYPLILGLIRGTWRCRRTVVDATGVGGGLAAFLGAALPRGSVTPYVYTAASKSKLAFDFLATVNSGRFRIYAESSDAVANESRRELLSQVERAQYSMRAGNVMAFFVPSHRGHDDLLNASVLVVQASALSAVRAARRRE